MGGRVIALLFVGFVAALVLLDGYVFGWGNE
jgi:hypothetical protein